MSKFKWGIIGCGVIAGKFTESLRVLKEAELEAVASRTPGKAKAFAKKYEVDTYYDTYEALLENTEIELVYVATTHNLHYENVLLCLEHGKNVLCEKVFTINSNQARHLKQLAESKGLFLMEAMWTRFLPAIVELKKLIDSGLIGEVMFLEADFSHKRKLDYSNRYYDLNLAGGALMDQGIYPVSFASMIFGQQPRVINANVCMAHTGVDVRSTSLFDYGDGKAAILNTSIAYNDRIHAVIAGTKGTIDIPDFFLSSNFTVKTEGKEINYTIPFESTGKQYEAQEVMDCIRQGKIQSNQMSLDETVAIMETMDEIRKQHKLNYPEAMEAYEK